MIVCQGCGKKFIPRRKDQIYCSNRCYNSHYRKVYEPIRIDGIRAHVIERNDGVQICQIDKTKSLFVLLSPKYAESRPMGRLRLEMAYHHLKFLTERFASLGDSTARFSPIFGKSLREVKDHLRQLEAYLQDRRLRTTYVSPRIKKQEKILELWKILEREALKKRLEEQEKSESESEEREEEEQEEEQEAEEWEQDLEEEEDAILFL